MRSDRETSLWLPRTITLLFLTFSYGGGLQILGGVSSVLLYGTYGTALVCICMCLFADSRLLGRTRPVLVYLLWVLVYVCWGLLASPNAADLLGDGLRLLLLNIFLVSFVTLVLPDETQWRRFARLVQIAAMINAVICLREAFDPELTRTICGLADASGKHVLVDRPGGLWMNPNEAAFGYIFALLLSFWVLGPLAWAGRVAALCGIYLGASRTGLFISTFCLLAYLSYRLYVEGKNPRAIAGSMIACWVGGIALVVAISTFAEGLDFSENRVLGRVENLNEHYVRSEGVISRAEIAEDALNACLHAPWYGDGLFSFSDFQHTAAQAPEGLPIGTHVIFLVVFGELGILGLVLYLGVLAVGVRRVLTTRLLRQDRFVLMLLWGSYLGIALVWHNQFDSMLGMIQAGILYCLPNVLRQSVSVPSARLADLELVARRLGVDKGPDRFVLSA